MNKLDKAATAGTLGVHRYTIQTYSAFEAPPLRENSYSCKMSKAPYNLESKPRRLVSRGGYELG